MSVRPITDAETDHFQQKGWVHLKSLVDKDTVSYLHDRSEAAYAENRTTGEFGPIVDRNFSAFLGEPRDSDVSKTMVQSPVMGRNIARLLDVPGIRLLADGYMLKMPQREGAHDDTLYHQDFPGNPVDRSTFLTVWVALHDMTPEMGVMRFYDGSHMSGVHGQVFADGIDLRKRVRLKDQALCPPFAMKAGDATAHHSLTIHGAPPNASSSRRWAYNILYMDSRCRYTGSPGLFPEGLVVEPMTVLDQSIFPLLPMS